MAVYKYRFDSIDELVSALDAPLANARNSSDIIAGAHNTRWACAHRETSCIADTQRHLAAQTFPEGVALVAELTQKLDAPTPVNRRRRPVRAPEGDELDIGRVWDGDLEHAWRNTRREQSVGPSRVLVAVQINAPAYVQASTLAWRGATALAYTSALLEAGFVVELIACTRNTLLDAENSTYSADVTLLGAGEQLDVHKLASLTASGLLFRGVILEHENVVSLRYLSAGTSTGKGPLTASQLDTAGFDYVAVVGENQHDRLTAQSWLQLNIAALDMHQH